MADGVTLQLNTLGDAPSRADYGLMGPLYAHLGRDPYPVRIMQQKAPLVFRWVERMNAPETETPEYPDRAPAFFDAATAPPTFRAFLKQAVTECSDDRILELVQQIPPGQTQLIKTLQQLAENFLFPEIMDLIPEPMLEQS